MNASQHVILSSQYGCPATLTTVRFSYKGVAHVARRFWRRDMPSTGAVEIYLIDPTDGMEDMLRCAPAVGGTALDQLAKRLVECAMADISPSVSERFALLELA